MVDKTTIRPGCGQVDCDPTLIEPVDINCRSHNRSLIGAFRSPIFLSVVGVPACLLVWLAFLVAPVWDSPLPVYVAVCAIGGLAVWLPLRTYPVAGPSVAVGWLLACTLAPLLSSSKTTTVAAAVTIVAAFVAAAWVVRLVLVAFSLNRESAGGGGIQGAALTASLLGLALIIACLYLLTRLMGTFNVEVPAPLVGQFRLLAGIVAIVALAGVASVAAVRAFGGILRGGKSVIPIPNRPRSQGRWSAARQPSGGSIGRFLDQFGHLIVRAMILLSGIIVMASYWLLRIFISVVNWIILWVDAGTDIVTQGLSLLVTATWEGLRVVVIPALGLCTAAAALFAFARADVRYALGGDPAELGVLTLCALSAQILLTAVWFALCAIGITRARDAVNDMSSLTMAPVIMLIVAGSWILGAVGAMGYGPFRFGWLTYGTTACVAAVMIWWFMWRRPDREPAKRSDPLPQPEGIAP